MILYNVTVKIDPEVREDWLQWMQHIHIPEVMATGAFLSCRMCRLEAEEETDSTYVIQYMCPDPKSLDEYLRVHAPDLQKAHTERYQGRFAAFRTMMTQVAEWSILQGKNG